MKYRKLLVTALLFLFYFEPRAQSVSKDLHIFLRKFEIYTTAHKAKVRWNMPIAKLEGVSMPNAGTILGAFTEDIKTGLRFYPQYHKVYDPETGYYLEYDAEAEYQVNFNSGKVYNGKKEVKLARK